MIQYANNYFRQKHYFISTCAMCASQCHNIYSGIGRTLYSKLNIPFHCGPKRNFIEHKHSFLHCSRPRGESSFLKKYSLTLNYTIKLMSHLQNLTSVQRNSSISKLHIEHSSLTINYIFFTFSTFKLI